MESKLSKALGYLAIGLILVIAMIIVIRWATDFLDWARFEAGDLGTWIGAIGTVATLAMTIWLATESERRRRREQHDLALVKVCEFSTRVSQLHIVAKVAVERMESDSARGVATNYSNLSTIFAEHPIWSAEELAPLVCIKGHLAARLAFLGSQIGAVIEEIANAQSLPRYQSPEGSKQFNSETVIRLKGFLKPLDIAFYDCLAFISGSGFTEAWREAYQRQPVPNNPLAASQRPAQ